MLVFHTLNYVTNPSRVTIICRIAVGCWSSLCWPIYDELSKKNRFQSVPIATLCLYNKQSGFLKISLYVTATSGATIVCCSTAGC